MVRMWNYDKPHRCPECHRTWVYQTKDDYYGVTPRWWKTYTCKACGAKFTGRWAWWSKMRDMYVSRIINRILRELSR